MQAPEPRNNFFGHDQCELLRDSFLEDAFADLTAMSISAEMKKNLLQYIKSPESFKKLNARKELKQILTQHPIVDGSLKLLHDIYTDPSDVIKKTFGEQFTNQGKVTPVAILAVKNLITAMITEKLEIIKQQELMAKKEIDHQKEQEQQIKKLLKEVEVLKKQGQEVQEMRQALAKSIETSDLRIAEMQQLLKDAKQENVHLKEVSAMQERYIQALSDGDRFANIDYYLNASDANRAIRAFNTPHLRARFTAMQIHQLSDKFEEFATLFFTEAMEKSNKYKSPESISFVDIALDSSIALSRKYPCATKRLILSYDLLIKNSNYRPDMAEEIASHAITHYLNPPYSDLNLTLSAEESRFFSQNLISYIKERTQTVSQLINPHEIIFLLANADASCYTAFSDVMTSVACAIVTRKYQSEFKKIFDRILTQPKFTQASLIPNDYPLNYIQIITELYYQAYCENGKTNGRDVFRTFILQINESSKIPHNTFFKLYFLIATRNDWLEKDTLMLQTKLSVAGEEGLNFILRHDVLFDRLPNAGRDYLQDIYTNHKQELENKLRTMPIPPKVLKLLAEVRKLANPPKVHSKDEEVKPSPLSLPTTIVKHVVGLDALKKKLQPRDQEILDKMSPSRQHELLKKTIYSELSFEACEYVISCIKAERVPLGNTLLKSALTMQCQQVLEAAGEVGADFVMAHPNVLSEVIKDGKKYLQSKSAAYLEAFKNRHPEIAQQLALTEARSAGDASAEPGHLTFMHLNHLLRP